MKVVFVFSDSSSLSLSMRHLPWIMLVYGVLCTTNQGQAQIWKITTKDGKHDSGTLLKNEFGELVVDTSRASELNAAATIKPVSPPVATALKWDRGRSSTNTRQSNPGKLNMRQLNLGKVDRLARPNRPRILPGIGWRQLELVNSDRLHVRLSPQEHSNPDGENRGWSFFGPADQRLFASRRDLAKISQSPESHFLYEADFESQAAGWSTGSHGTPVQLAHPSTPDSSQSLICSSNQPKLIFNLPPGIESGGVQFRFLADTLQAQSNSTNVSLHFAQRTMMLGKQAPVPQRDINVPGQLNSLQRTSVEVNLTGHVHQAVTTAAPANCKTTRQSIGSQRGWRNLTVAFTPSRHVVSLDGNLLVSNEFPSDIQQVFTRVEFSAPSDAASVWIDDFVVSEKAPMRNHQRLQSETDEIRFKSGDQLFGTVEQLGLERVRIAWSPHKSDHQWAMIDEVQFAEVPVRSHAVQGLYCRIDLQPLWNVPDWRQADSIHAVLLDCLNETVFVQHAFLGKLEIPVSEIREMRPLFQGLNVILAARPIHFGDEILSHFTTPVPYGKRWSQEFQLPSQPKMPSHLRLLALDLEPASDQARKTTLWQRLRAGEFVTELRVNSGPPMLLNQHVTGHGSAVVPQVIDLTIDPKQLRIGKNLVELELKPSRDEVPEYDDWELLSLSLEIPTQQ